MGRPSREHCAFRPSSRNNNNGNNNPSPTSDGSLCKCGKEKKKGWKKTTKNNLPFLQILRLGKRNKIGTLRQGNAGRRSGWGRGSGRRLCGRQRPDTPFVLARNWSNCELASGNSGAEETLPPIRRHCNNKLLLCSGRARPRTKAREKGRSPTQPRLPWRRPPGSAPLAYILVTLLYTFATYIHMGTYATIKKRTRAPRAFFWEVAKDNEKCLPRSFVLAPFSMYSDDGPPA